LHRGVVQMRVQPRGVDEDVGPGFHHGLLND
jgi:hypothetical protein